jgi:hypothetical protein
VAIVIMAVFRTGAVGGEKAWLSGAEGTEELINVGFGTNNSTGGFGQQAQQNTGSSFTFGAQQNNQPQQQQNTGFGAAGGNTSFCKL